MHGPQRHQHQAGAWTHAEQVCDVSLDIETDRRVDGYDGWVDDRSIDR